MNALFEQIRNIFSAIPLMQKIMMGAVLLLVLFGCMGLFLYGQKAAYQPLYGSLSTEDAASIAEELAAQDVPFQIQGGGTLILVPAERVYDLRLSLASSGLPKGGGVGFEIFDETDFGTTEFVQKLNYQRALQGELARTIKEFNEVSDARVMIVMAEDSVFIEESKPATASVLLKLRSGLSKPKVEAVVNLVAGAVEDLATGNVTVVDTEGNVLSKKAGEEDQGEISDAKLEYKLTYENNLAKQIQTMLERIVGSGKAIVRVAADMNFDQVDLSEEIYDPEAQVVRSRQLTTDSQENIEGLNSTSVQAASDVSSVDPAVVEGEESKSNNRKTETAQKRSETVNYEISRTIRRTLNPVAEIERLSVAAVLDGTYTVETDKNGNQIRTYVPRTEAEIETFTDIVRSAMGYSSDREDQVSVESVPFDSMDEMGFEDGPGTDWPALMRRYGHLAGYAALIAAAFMFLIKPILRTVQELGSQVRQASMTVRQEAAEALPGPEMASRGALPPPEEMSGREKAVYLARQDMDKTTEQVRGWLSEAS
jgi:flagellar M-ring protein FliF